MQLAFGISKESHTRQTLNLFVPESVQSGVGKQAARRGTVQGRAAFRTKLGSRRSTRVDKNGRCRVRMCSRCQRWVCSIQFPPRSGKTCRPSGGNRCQRPRRIAALQRRLWVVQTSPTNRRAFHRTFQAGRRKLRVLCCTFVLACLLSPTAEKSVPPRPGPICLVCAQNAHARHLGWLVKRHTFIVAIDGCPAVQAGSSGGKLRTPSVQGQFEFSNVQIQRIVLARRPRTKRIEFGLLLQVRRHNLEVRWNVVLSRREVFQSTTGILWSHKGFSAQMPNETPVPHSKLFELSCKLLKFAIWWPT